MLSAVPSSLPVAAGDELPCLLATQLLHLLDVLLAVALVAPVAQSSEPTRLSTLALALAGAVPGIHHARAAPAPVVTDAAHAAQPQLRGRQHVAEPYRLLQVRGFLPPVRDASRQDDERAAVRGLGREGRRGGARRLAGAHSAEANLGHALGHDAYCLAQGHLRRGLGRCDLIKGWPADQVRCAGGPDPGGKVRIRVTSARRLRGCAAPARLCLLHVHEGVLHAELVRVLLYRQIVRRNGHAATGIGTGLYEDGVPGRLVHGDADALVGHFLVGLQQRLRQWPHARDLLRAHLHHLNAMVRRELASLDGTPDLEGVEALNAALLREDGVVGRHLQLGAVGKRH
mmetsp:Transcript_70597/g.182035  ORF Transcript_70597/g.182035 Transcript_70597/m.182035 type:complete len:343 (-) Transcript_70597:1609-2637(-)